MAMKQVRSMAVAALLVGTQAVRDVHFDTEETQLHTEQGELASAHLAEEDTNANVIKTVTEAPRDWRDKLKDAANAVFTKTECCCSNEEPLLLYFCIEKGHEESKATDANIFSTMFKTSQSVDEITQMNTKDKRKLVPLEKEHRNKDRTVANQTEMGLELIDSIHFHGRSAMKCSGGKSLANAEGVTIDTYAQLAAEDEAEADSAFYRYRVAETLDWSDERFLSIGGAMYKKKDDTPNFQCIDEESAVQISFDKKKGATCKEFTNCKKVLHTGVCGPEEGKWSLYELHGRSDGTCEHLIRGQWCPKKGFENSWMKPIYGDTFGMYKLCLCNGKKGC